MKQIIKNSAGTHGLIIGSLLATKFMFSTASSFTLSLLATFISVVIVFAMYGFAINFREKKCKGSLSYGQAFSFLFQIYFYGTILSSLVILIYCQFINTQFLESQVNQSLLLYKNFGFPVDDNTQKMIQLTFKPATYALGNLISGAIIGAFWGAILAAFVKKEKNIFENEQ